MQRMLWLLRFFKGAAKLAQSKCKSKPHKQFGPCFNDTFMTLKIIKKSQIASTSLKRAALHYA
jgi:hypothetical protein